MESVNLNYYQRMVDNVYQSVGQASGDLIISPLLIMLDANGSWNYTKLHGL